MIPPLSIGKGIKLSEAKKLKSVKIRDLEKVYNDVLEVRDTLDVVVNTLLHLEDKLKELIEE